MTIPLQVLVFSTMTRALDVVQQLAEWRGWAPAVVEPVGAASGPIPALATGDLLRLDGATSAEERGALVAAFNAPGEWAGWHRAWAPARLSQRWTCKLQVQLQQELDSPLLCPCLTGPVIHGYMLQPKGGLTTYLGVGEFRN
jgi:hypothetical protein